MFDVLFLYLSMWLIKKFLVAETPVVTRLKKRISTYEKKPRKTLRQQMAYLTLKREQKKLQPFRWSKLLIHLAAILLYLAMLDGRTPFDYRVGLLVIPALTAGGIALFETENYKYHYAANAAYSVFIILYLTIQHFNPLYLFGIRMNILLLLPMLLVASLITKYITKKARRMIG